MIHKLLLSTGILAISLAASSTFAAEGTYVSVGAGHATVENMPSADTYGYYNNDLDATSTAFRVALGYSKDLNPKFGIGGELGYNDYGSQTYKGYTIGNYENTLEYDYSSVDLLSKMTWHATKSFDLYGKLGIAFEMVETSGNSNVSSNSKALPEVGLGMSYFATEKLSIDLAMYRTEGDDVEFTYNDDDNLPSIFTVLLGVNYYFG